MKKSILTLILAALIATPAAHAGGHGKHAGHHQARAMLQPMPNLMRVVKKFGPQLNLTEQQAATLAQWRDGNNAYVHGLLKQIQDARSALQASVMDGANAAQVAKQRAAIAKLRDQVVATKLACRDNMRRVLNDGQWQTLVSLYRQHFM